VISSIPDLRAELHVSAMYRRNFKPKIFTDITTPVKQSYSPDIGKISPEFEFKFKQKFLLNFLTVTTFSKPTLFSGDFSYKSGKTEVMIRIPYLLFLHRIGLMNLC
jgi:hypothetical protein